MGVFLKEEVWFRGGASSYGGFDLQGSMNQQNQHNLYEEELSEEGDKSSSAKGSLWQRVKWTDNMVKLLITAVSYIGDDSSMDGGNRRKFAALQKKDMSV
ncbi:hypothetical protein Bca4012_082595 [Brassica carinata]|uniref:Uncharacterized protein n=1 Tax=Brassica carinata TaxID=52824 RepID=A0A8X7VEP5_BRACI|nr:hypothetical protein Bca52824_029631 [Brassica carinata]